MMLPAPVSRFFLALLIASVGVAASADAQRRIDRPAWITSADYPAGAIEAGEGGIVVVRLDYSASGVVTRCKADGRRATRALGDLTCRLIQQRARYVPAATAPENPGRASTSSP